MPQNEHLVLAVGPLKTAVRRPLSLLWRFWLLRELCHKELLDDAERLPKYVAFAVVVERELRQRRLRKLPVAKVRIRHNAVLREKVA